jgi:hypothetical protein
MPWRTTSKPRPDDGGPGQPRIPHEATYLLGSVALSADLKCAFHEPSPPEPIVVFSPVAVPERLPLRRSGRADLIGDREAPVPVAHLQTCHAWRLLFVHVAKLVEFRSLRLVTCPSPAPFFASRNVSGMIWHGRSVVRSSPRRARAAGRPPVGKEKAGTSPRWTALCPVVASSA